MKTCFKCHTAKPMNEFYCHPETADGHLGKCKECTRRDVRQNYQDNHDHYLEYEHERAQKPDRRAQWAGQTRKQRATSPEKYKARQLVGNAIRDGRLSRGSCEVCGSIKRLEAHHDDYSKPFAVRWFCFKHHRETAHGQRTAA